MPDDDNELERLREKNISLLDELKTARAQNADLTKTNSEQAGRLQRYDVDGPVDRMIAEVALRGSESLWKLAFQQHFKFEHTDKGVVVRTLDGKPVMLPPLSGTKGREKERAAEFTADDIKALVAAEALKGTFDPITLATKASGSGGTGKPAASGATKTPEPAQRPPAEIPLGLR